MNTFEIVLDVDKRGNNESVNLRQGDIMGTTISAKLRDHDAPMEGGEYSAYFCMTLPDRKTYYRTEAIYADGVVSVVVDERYAAQTPGATNNAYFELWDGEELKYTTDSFVVRIKASAMEGEAAQSYDVRVESLMDDMRAVMEQESIAESERATAEEERKEAESAREEAESARATTFEENEAQRESTFSDNETQRASTFEANEQGRSDVFEDNETERAATFSEGETERSDTFATNEAERIATFSANEQERADIFATNETERVATFSANETERADTFEENETERARTFAASEAERQAIFENSFAPPTVTVEETSYGHVAHITWKDANGEHVSDLPTSDATSIVVTGDTLSIPVDYAGKCLESGTARFSFSGWVGSKRVPCTAALTLAPDARYTVQLTNATATSEGLIRVSYTAGLQYPNAENVCTVSLSCNGKSYVHRVSSIAPKAGRPVTSLDVSSDNVIMRLDGNGNTYAGTHLVRITPTCGDTRLPITNVTFSGPSWITAQSQGVTVIENNDSGNSVTTNYATGALLLSWTEGNSYTASGDLMTCGVEISYMDDGVTYTENRPIYFQGVRDGAVGPVGPQGIQGIPGVDGITPTAEVTKAGDTATITITDAKGTTTAQLTDGVDGKDGISPTAKVERSATGALVTITDASGTTTAQITDGRTGDTGATGPQGPAGEDGVSPTVTLAEIDGGHRITVTDADGEHSFTVPNYSDEEDARRAAENARAQAEASRASAESARASAETSRASAESSRVAAEQARVSAETSRASAMRQIESDAADAVASTQVAASSAERAESELRAAAQRGDFDGADGISPTATVTQTASGATITVTDKSGTTTATVHDGATGPTGPAGADGTSPTVAVAPITGGHSVTITDAVGAHSFEVMDGERGETGVTGPTGPAGADGVSPAASVTQTANGATITVTDKSGTTTADIANGATGPMGPQGPAGSDGVSPTVATTEISGGHRVAVTDADGTQSFDVLDGPQGEDGADGFSPTVSVSSITGGHEVTITDATGAHTFDVMDSAGGIPYATVDATSTSTAFTATVEGVTRLANGTTVVLHNGVVTSAENFTININGLGAKKCYNNMTNATQETTIFNVAYTLMFVYSTALDSGNGGWWIYRGYDSDAGMTVLQYGTSTWADFQAAYEANKLVYCMYKVAANEARMAFLAYTYLYGSRPKAEFQYYRTVGTKSATQQGDEVYIYTLMKNVGWTTTVRQTYTKIVAGTGLTSTYSANTGTLTLNATLPPATTSTLGGVKVGDGLKITDGVLSLDVPSANGVSF